MEFVAPLTRLVRRPRRPRGPSLALLLAGLCLMAGCDERQETAKTLPVPGAFREAPDRGPGADRDLKEIQTEGVLRVATRPGPTTWMLFQGREAGFERDLLAAFCDEWNLDLSPVLPRGGELLSDLLHDGRADVVADNLVLTDALHELGRPTRGLDRSALHVVLGDRGPEHSDAAAALEGLTVTLPWENQAADGLAAWRDSLGLRLHITRARPSVTLDDLLHAVAAGEIDATVAPASTILSAQARLPDLRLGAPLTPDSGRTWLVRESSPALAAALDRFLARNIDGGRRSRLYGILYERFIGDPRQARYHQQDRYRARRSGHLSPWDEMIRDISDASGLDWLVVTSLMFEESRFDPAAVSRADAVGLMQVLPRFSAADSTQLSDPATNIRAGTDLLRDIWDSYDYLAPEDRWPFTLATYHAGAGHMNDARRIAMDSELDPNRWEGHVTAGLRRLRDRATPTRYGFYRGDMSVEYAESILRRAAIYRRVLGD